MPWQLPYIEPTASRCSISAAPSAADLRNTRRRTLAQTKMSAAILHDSLGCCNPFEELLHAAGGRFCGPSRSEGGPANQFLECVYHRGHAIERRLQCDGKGILPRLILACGLIVLSVGLSIALRCREKLKHGGRQGYQIDGLLSFTRGRGLAP